MRDETRTFVTHRFDTEVLHGDDLFWAVTICCVAGSRTVQVMDREQWRWWPAHARIGVDGAGNRHATRYLNDPNNEVLFSRQSSDPRRVAWAILRAIHDGLGVEDPSRVSLQFLPRPDDEVQQLLRQRINLGAVFAPPKVHAGASWSHSASGNRLPSNRASNCVVCGQELSDPTSALRMMGPDCFRRVVRYGRTLDIQTHQVELGEYLTRIARSKWSIQCWAGASAVGEWDSALCAQSVVRLSKQVGAPSRSDK